MDKDFERLIDQVMDENDEALRALAEIEADEKKANPLLYILTEEDRHFFTKEKLDLPRLNIEDAPTLREDLMYSASMFEEFEGSLDNMSDEAIFELADWYEYLWTK